MVPPYFPAGMALACALAAIAAVGTDVAVAETTGADVALGGAVVAGAASTGRGVEVADDPQAASRMSPIIIPAIKKKRGPRVLPGNMNYPP